MTNSKPRESPSDPLLPPPQHPQPYILLPVYPRRRSRYCAPSTLLLSLLALTLIAAAVFALWPSDPSLRVVRLRLDHLHVTAKPPVSIDVSLAVKLRIRNPDFFAVDYRSLDVAIGYRGRQLGKATSEGGRVRARTVSYVDAELRLDGIQVLHDVFYLIEDVLKGSIPFDTVTEIKGVLHFLVFDIPIKVITLLPNIVFIHIELFMVSSKPLVPECFCMAVLGARFLESAQDHLFVRSTPPKFFSFSMGILSSRVMLLVSGCETSSLVTISNDGP